MKNEGIPIVKEGVPFLLITGLATFACGLQGVWPLFVLFLVGTCYIAYFFRNPERLPPVGALTVASPADGKVIFVGRALESEFLNEEVYKVSIFMSLWDVHVNRIPIDGTIRNKNYRKGRFMAAFEERAPEENERNALLIETARAEKLVVVQVAGLIARRIVCYPNIGGFVLKGQRMGLIRFGSRCDLYLPISAEISVAVGDKVLGGETLIARLANVVKAQ